MSVVTHLLSFEHQRQLTIFQDLGVTSYGNELGKDVVNRCILLFFAVKPVLNWANVFFANLVGSIR